MLTLRIEPAAPQKLDSRFRGNERVGAAAFIAQCRATVSGIGGFCEPNQFYNPRRAAARSRNRSSR